MGNHNHCHKSWKVLSQNFLFLELKSPGKFCLAEKIVLEFSRNIFTKNGHSRNLQSWNFPFLEFILVQELSVHGILFHGIYLLPPAVPDQRHEIMPSFDVPMAKVSDE